MKFWKILSYLILETLPDWRDKFLSYKDLKKQLKLIYPSPTVNHHHHISSPIKRPRLSGDNSCDAPDNSPDVTDFVSLLEAELDKFNSFFVEKEEEYVIRWKELQDRLAEGRHLNEEPMGIGREIVDFHGEMVLLENYSALNYTGLVKILKKYDKRSGALIRLPFIQKVLQEPFYSNDTLSKLIKECETTLDALFSHNEPPASSQVATTAKPSEPKASTKKIEGLLTADKELEEIKHMESMYMKLTLSALRALKEIRGGSSTVNAFSLPPLDTTKSLEEKAWEKVPFVEQAAK